VPEGAGRDASLDVEHGRRHALQIGNELRDGIGEANLAVLDEHQNRHTDHRLGHRHDAEDGVLLHRLLAVDVHQPVRLEMRDAAVARDERHGPGEVLRGNLTLHQLADALQPI
jgi:hypothetical protein